MKAERFEHNDEERLRVTCGCGRIATVSRDGEQLTIEVEYDPDADTGSDAESDAGNEPEPVDAQAAEDPNPEKRKSYLFGR